MNKILKRVISGVTSLSLGMTLVGTMPAIADEAAVTSETIRTLSVDFMGRGEAPQDSSPGSARLTSEDIGKEFWVGVAVDNVNDLPLFTDGIYSLEIAFEYDPEFVEPYFTSGSVEAEWATALEDGNLTNINNSVWWNSEQYEIISVAETDIDTVTDRENSDKMVQRADDGWKMCTVCVTLKDGASFSNARFKSLTEATKQYLLKLPFKLNAVPADDAVDTNPKVLSLVRGPETFDIGSGETGTNPYSAWEATVTDSEDVTNMKNLFTFSGDISLFDSGGAIENIVPVKTKTDEEENDTSYTLSTGKDLTLDGFKIETLEYYLSVSDDVEKIKLNITSSELPEVTANSESVETTASADKLYETAEFKLNELDKTVEADGYNNIVTVTAGGVTYTIYIRRLLKPKIELNPGNSPYGLIEQMSTKYLGEEDGWSDEKIEQAKVNFENSDSVHGNLQYAEGYIPNSAKTGVKYTTAAWSSYDANYDLDSKAIFVYEASDFVDPGIRIYDSQGEELQNITYDRQIVFKVMSVGEPDYDKELSSDVREIKNKDNSYVFSLKGKIIRPDVYEMEYIYNYTDDNMQIQTLTAKRKVIVLSERGDIQLTTDPSFNANDVKSFAVSYSKWGGDNANSLFAFRVCDLQETTDCAINANDYKKMLSDAAKYSTFPYEQYYTELPAI